MNIKLVLVLRYNYKFITVQNMAKHGYIAILHEQHIILYAYHYK